MATITEEWIEEEWRNLANKIEETLEERAKTKGENMENNGLSLIEKDNIIGDIPTKKLALDGKEIPGQIGIRQIVSDRRGFKIVTVAFDVPDEESIEKQVKDGFNKAREKVYFLYNLAMSGRVVNIEKVAKEIGGLQLSFLSDGKINKETLMGDIARAVLHSHLALWDIVYARTEYPNAGMGDPTLEFMGVDKTRL